MSLHLYLIRYLVQEGAGEYTKCFHCMEASKVLIFPEEDHEDMATRVVGKYCIK